MEINNILKIYNLLFIIFKKGHPAQKSRCPDTLDTPPRSAPALLPSCHVFCNVEVAYV